MENFSFDIWTLLMVFSVLTSIFGIGFIIFGQKYNTSFSGIKTIGSSMVLTAIGTFLNALQLLLNPIISQALANIIILLGVHFLFIGVVKYNKAKTSFLLNNSLLVVAIFFSIIFFIDNSILGRIIVISTYTALYFSRMAYLFMLNSKSYNYKIHQALSLLFILMAIINIYRIFNTWFNLETNILTGTPGQSLGIIMLIICVIVMSINFFNLVTNELAFIKNVLTSTLAHEMRTPFNSIIGFTQLLSVGELSENQQKDYIDYINLSAHNGMQSLDNLLEWSKRRIANISLNIQDIDLAEIFDDFLDINQPLIEHKKITVEKSIKENNLKGDKHLISLIISNLISNAIKYTPSEGKIKLYSDKVEAYCEFSISNNGSPLTKNEIKSMNINDIQESKKGTQSEKGSGLGLFIVKSFIELLKGKLIIESDGVTGSTFKVQIPLK